MVGKIKEVKKDAAGFEDVDAFWDAADTNTNNTTIKSYSSSNNNDTITTVDETLNYDTSDSISIEEEEEEDSNDNDDNDDDEEEEEDDKNTTNNKSNRRASSLSSSLPIEDTPSLVSSRGGRRSSPFSSNESPFISSSPKVSMDDDNNDFGYDGQDYDDYEPMETTTPASRSSKKAPASSGGRRVSFGDGTKVGTSSTKHRTPGSVRSSAATTPDANQSMISTPGSNEFTRGRVLKDDTYIEDDNEDDEEQDEDTDSEGDTSADKSFLSEIKKRKNQIENDQEEDDDEDDESGGRRRSKRATKGQKFAFWKNERPVYNQGELVGRIAANPTPKKPKKKEERVKIQKLKNLSENEEIEMPLVLPKGVKYIDRDGGDELSVWDDESDAAKQTRCVCYRETLEPASALPITAVRPKGKDGVAYAAQSFNVAENPGIMSGWISGFVELPPGSIKDAEGVGECTQVFFISDCQDESIEIGIASPDALEWNDKTAQRQLLKKGDSFYVPSGNIYRLENHSQSKSCFIYWTIIKPLEIADSARQ